MPQWLAVQLKQPVENPGKWRVRMHQNYNRGKHLVGRFRLWATTAAQPLGPGLRTGVAAAVIKPPTARTSAEIDALGTAFAAEDKELMQRVQTLFLASRPLPTEPVLQKLKDALADASQPVPLDPELDRLRRDHALSERQLASLRLTFAQDVTWTLINSSAFLFNH
jgi:hypothetical protein